MKIKFINTVERSWWFIFYFFGVPRFCIAWPNHRVWPYIGLVKVDEDPFPEDERK
jgi:hypothetical protein